MVVHPIKAFKSNARDQETAGQGGAARRAFNSGACEQHHVIHRLSFRRASRVRLKAVLRRRRLQSRDLQTGHDRRDEHPKTARVSGELEDANESYEIAG